MSVFAPLTFLRQTFENFHTTGAVAPSSSFLARAMVQSLPLQEQIPDSFRVLEVGPGTGSFTVEIVARMNGSGRLDLYEINALFVAHLKGRLERETRFQTMRSRIALHQANVLELPAEPVYDAIISGLPLNNFAPEEVRKILAHFKGLLKPGGTLTYFEYAAIRRLKAPFVGGEGRRKLKGIAGVVEEFARTYQIRKKLVPLNLPPAWVRYFRFEHKPR